MILITVNSGSTSVKLAAYQAAAARAAPTLLVREQHGPEAGAASSVLGAFLAHFDRAQIAAVGHRVVHGGTRFTAPVRIDRDTLEGIQALSSLAPLHNPVALTWISAALAVCAPEVVQVAAFDTAFFARLPAVAAHYALPAELGEALGVRRYGFHGLAHEAMCHRWGELRPELGARGRVVTLQLGGGCSMAAIRGGEPIDTTMGFSPLEGLVMATRSGDVDAAIVPHLAARRGVTAERIVEMLNHEAGLKGLSGASEDLRALVGSADPRARLAVDLYCYRARKYLGASFAALGGCDGIVFGGGVGEHMPEIRARILDSLGWAGVELDPVANAAARGAEASIGRAGAPVSVHVIPVDEEHTLASAALACLTRPA